MTQSKKIIVAWNTFVDHTYLPLERNVKIGLAVLLLLMPLALFSFLSFLPGSQKIQDLTSQKDQLSQELHLAKTRARTLDKHKAEMAEVERLETANEKSCFVEGFDHVVC